MSLQEVLRNSPWRPGFGRVVQEYNLAAPVLNSCCETGRSCAGLGLAQGLSPACGVRQTIVVLKPTSPGTQPVKRSKWDPWGAIFISCLWTTGAPLLCPTRYVTRALWLAATWRFLPSLKLGRLVPAPGMCLSSTQHTWGSRREQASTPAVRGAWIQCENHCWGEGLGGRNLVPLPEALCIWGWFISSSTLKVMKVWLKTLTTLLLFCFLLLILLKFFELAYLTA